MPSYSKHFEMLAALVTYMAMDTVAMRQPKWFANQLSSDLSTVKDVLAQFKGLFHESKSKSDDYGDSYYSLHLRYARQQLDENEKKKVRPPLQLEDLMELLKFISQKADQETRRTTGITSALIGAAVAIFASLTTVIIALTR